MKKLQKKGITSFSFQARFTSEELHQIVCGSQSRNWMSAADQSKIVAYAKVAQKIYISQKKLAVKTPWLYQ